MHAQRACRARSLTLAPCINSCRLYCCGPRNSHQWRQAVPYDAYAILIIRPYCIRTTVHHTEPTFGYAIEWTDNPCDAEQVVDQFECSRREGSRWPLGGNERARDWKLPLCAADLLGMSRLWQLNDEDPPHEARKRVTDKVDSTASICSATPYEQ